MNELLERLSRAMEAQQRHWRPRISCERRCRIKTQTELALGRRRPPTRRARCASADATERALAHQPAPVARARRAGADGPGIERLDLAGWLAKPPPSGAAGARAGHRSRIRQPAAGARIEGDSCPLKEMLNTSRQCHRYTQSGGR